MATNIIEERQAAIAFVLDRVQQYAASSGYQAFAAELVAGLAEGRHVECARAGEYSALRVRVRRIMRAHGPTRAKRKAVR